MLLDTGQQELSISAVKDSPRPKQPPPKARGSESHVGIEQQAKFKHRNQAFLPGNLYHLPRATAHLMKPGREGRKSGMICGLKLRLLSVKLQWRHFGLFRAERRKSRDTTCVKCVQFVRAPSCSRSRISES